MLPRIAAQLAVGIDQHPGNGVNLTPSILTVCFPSQFRLVTSEGSLQEIASGNQSPIIRQ